MLNRRTLLTALASLPLCGWIKPKAQTPPSEGVQTFRFRTVETEQEVIINGHRVTIAVCDLEVQYGNGEWLKLPSEWRNALHAHITT